MGKMQHWTEGEEQTINSDYNRERIVWCQIGQQED